MNIKNKEKCTRDVCEYKPVYYYNGKPYCEVCYRKYIYRDGK